MAVFNSSDVFELALEKSSMGNLIAEYETVFFYLKNNLLVLLFGKGMGGTVPDIFGYLAPWAGSSGYPIESLSLNAFYKMPSTFIRNTIKRRADTFNSFFDYKHKIVVGKGFYWLFIVYFFFYAVLLF